MKRVIYLLVVLLIAWAPGNAIAHEVRPAYLELRQTSVDTFDVLWKVPAQSDTMRLGLYVRFGSDCDVIAEARSRFANAAYLERWSIRHADALVGSTIHIDGLKTTMTDVLVRIERLDGTTLVARLTPTNDALLVTASPGVFRVAWTYLTLGFEHILLGIDHLLFVLALLLLVKEPKRVVATITAFTIAHSITLAAAALGAVRLPGPPVEAVIALSIAFVAAEIVREKRGKQGWSARWPWGIAFAFGLLHGLGFAGALTEVGLPQKAIPVALLFFNVGVEVGQLAFIGFVALAAAVLQRVPGKMPKWTDPIPTYAIGSVAMFWVIERVAGF